jgi:hypothetical protein
VWDEKREKGSMMEGLGLDARERECTIAIMVRGAV